VVTQFEQAASKHPNSPCAVFKDEMMTYAEVRDISGRPFQKERTPPLMDRLWQVIGGMNPFLACPDLGSLASK
jgi:hypothetical protein